MSKTITVKSANNQSTTVNASDNATVQQILSSTEVLTFFGRSGSEIAGAFSGLDGQPVNPAFREYMLQAAPGSGAVIEVSISVATFGASTSAAPACVPGTVVVKWNGGTYSLDLQGIQIGVATVKNIVDNPLVARRFSISATQLSACDVTLEHAGVSTRLNPASRTTTKVANGDIVWLQARAADDKGINA